MEAHRGCVQRVIGCILLALCVYYGDFDLVPSRYPSVIPSVTPAITRRTKFGRSLDGKKIMNQAQDLCYLVKTPGKFVYSATKDA